MFLMHINILPTYKYVQHVHEWWPQKRAEGFHSPGSAVMDAWGLPRGLWEPNLVLIFSSHKCS